MTIANPFQVSRFMDQKESELDILYRDDNKREIQLEMQIVAHTGLDQLNEPMFQEALDVITGFTKEQKFRHAYDMRENYERIVQSYIHTGFLDGLQKGKQDGFQEGAQNAYLDMAGKLKAAGMPLEQIIQLTNLDADEIEML